MPLQQCPRCHSNSIDLTKYRSMMVISAHQAVFNVRCPVCGNFVEDIWPIPDQMMGMVADAAHRMHAGMGMHAGDDGEESDIGDILRHEHGGEPDSSPSSPRD